MPKPSKKVVLLIVEGVCDEYLLTSRLKELYKDYNILFEVQHGDVLYNSYDKKKSPIKGTIGDIVSKFIKKRKFRNSDMLAVLHIIDTDGCLIPDQNVVIDANQQENTFYQLDMIAVPSQEQRDRILARNKERSRNIYNLSTVGQINHFTYRLYYFSRNLEHVLFDEPNPIEDEKFNEVDNFLISLTVPIEEYLKEYLPNLPTGTVDEQYKQSWVYIGQGVASLQRTTNVPLLFNYLQEIDL